MSGDDAGYSLVDLLVGMGLMSVLMVVTLAAITQIYSNVTRTENTSFAREQIGSSFRRLDRDLRYATYVDAPVSSTSAGVTTYSMTYSIPATTVMTETCRELTWDSNSRVLNWRKWVPGGTKPALAPIASNLALNSGAAPFTLIAPDSSIYGSIVSGAAGLGKEFAPAYYQVRIQFNARFGKVSLPLDAVFTAQNMTGQSTVSC